MTWKQIKAAAEKQGLSCKQVYELVEGQKPITNSDYAAARRALGEYCHKDKAVLGTNIVNFDKWLKTRLNLNEPDCA
jgi:hypothetical protein